MLFNILLESIYFSVFFDPLYTSFIDYFLSLCSISIQEGATSLTISNTITWCLKFAAWFASVSFFLFVVFLAFLILSFLFWRLCLKLDSYFATLRCDDHSAVSALVFNIIAWRRRYLHIGHRLVWEVSLSLRQVAIFVLDLQIWSGELRIIRSPREPTSCLIGLRLRHLFTYHGLLRL